MCKWTLRISLKTKHLLNTFLYWVISFFFYVEAFRIHFCQWGFQCFNVNFFNRNTVQNHHRRLLDRCDAVTLFPFLVSIIRQSAKSDKGRCLCHIFCYGGESGIRHCRGVAPRPFFFSWRILWTRSHNHFSLKPTDESARCA